MLPVLYGKFERLVPVGSFPEPLRQLSFYNLFLINIIAFNCFHFIQIGSGEIFIFHLCQTIYFRIASAESLNLQQYNYLCNIQCDRELMEFCLGCFSV